MTLMSVLRSYTKKKETVSLFTYLHSKFWIFIRKNTPAKFYPESHRVYYSWYIYQMCFTVVQFHIEKNSVVGLVNLKCVTYIRPFPLSLNGHIFTFLELDSIIIINSPSPLPPLLFPFAPLHHHHRHHHHHHHYRGAKCKIFT